MTIAVYMGMNWNVVTYKCHLENKYNEQNHNQNRHKLTSGESNGYLLLNLNCNWKCSPSYKVPAAPSIFIIQLEINSVFQTYKAIITTYWSRFCSARSASTAIPGGGSFIKDISSFWSLF